MDNENIYGSGLNNEDWTALRDVIWPFLHASDPRVVEVSPRLPVHLQNHPLVSLIHEYQATGADDLLDRAGRLLIPTDKPFGWYAPLTK
jgi:hypothetical protein